MKKPEPVNPAARTDENAGDEGIDTNVDRHDPSHTKQSEQNQNANQKFDPTESRSPAQRRRTNNHGQVG